MWCCLAARCAWSRVLGLGDRVKYALSAQAPGGHNVIMGVFDYVKRLNPESEVIGFLMGPHGLYSGEYEVITSEKMDKHRNMGVPVQLFSSE